MPACKRGFARLLLFPLLLAFLINMTRAADHPNVVLIMTDDQGWGDVRSHGNDAIDTPTMDQMAASGARFEHFFVSPMCGPTRASLLTWRWNLRTGASWVSHGKEILRLDEVTLGDAFAAAGYATGAFGKWHNGEYGPYHLNHRGIQEFFGFCRGARQNYFDAVIERNGQPVRTEGYVPDALTDAALEFIEQNRQRSFFCYVPYNAPHHPYQVPEAYFTRYLNRGDGYELYDMHTDPGQKMPGSRADWSFVANKVGPTTLCRRNNVPTTGQRSGPRGPYLP